MKSSDTVFEQLDELLDKTGAEGRVRLATYLRRYISPTVAIDLLCNGKLELLTQQREVELVTVFFVDIRDFVRTVRQIENEGAGLFRAAQILEDFFSTAVDIIFEYEGMVGEFAGDRIMAVFGVPIPRHDDAQRAIKAAIKIQREVAKLQDKWQDERFMRLPGFNIGIGINTGGKVWVGDVGSSWRRELMVIGSTTNIAARVEELTKEQRYREIDGLNILATEATIERTREIVDCKKVGSEKLRGIDRPLFLYKIKGLEPDISLDTDRARLREDRELVSLIAERVESAIAIAKSTKVRETFAAIGRIMTAPSLELDHVLRTILQMTSALVGAKKASIGLVNEKTNRIEFKAALVPEELNELKDHPLEIGQGIIGRVIESGEPKKVDDASLSNEFYSGVDEVTGLRTRSVLCVPLKIGSKITGAIEVMDEEANKFTDEALMLLQSIAASTAILVENAQLHESIVSRAIGLKKIADALTSSIFDLREIFRTIMEGLKEMLDPQIGSIMLINEKGELEAKATIIPGDLEKMVPVKIGQGIAGWVAEHGEPVLIEDAQLDERFYSGIDKRTGYTTRSVLCVPMKVGPKVIGVIQVLDQAPNRFDFEDLNILSSIAASASVAFENSEQYKRRVDAEKIVAMSEMASDFVHRINNKVGFIRTTARRIERQLQEGRLSNEFLAQKLRDIFCSAEDTIEIAKKIRDPFQPIKGELVDVNDCLSSALQDSQIPESIDVIAEYTTPLPLVTATQQLKEVFENLVRNAVEAMSNKGTLRVYSELKEGWVIVSVEDTGPGIPKQHQDKIFHLGFTTKKDGLGYGLWRSQTYMKKLGGSLYFEPDRSSGSKFVVELPVAELTGVQPDL